MHARTQAILARVLILDRAPVPLSHFYYVFLLLGFPSQTYLRTPRTHAVRAAFAQKDCGKIAT
jgi:hypothetical protein